MSRRMRRGARIVSRAVRLETLERRMLLSLSAAGGEFRPHSGAFMNQTAATVAADGDGDFIVAWQSLYDGSGYTIMARRYTSAGGDPFAPGPDGSQPDFRVNSFTTGNQIAPAAAMDADGHFVVVWQSAAQDGSGYGIYAQRYRGALRLGNEFRVNTTTAGNQTSAAVAMDADGDFVVAWTSANDIFAQRYNAVGIAQGGEFRVNTFTTNTQFQPSVAMDADGDFVIAWSSDSQDGSYFGAYAQRFNAAGIPQGGEFRVNTFTLGDQNSPSVAMDFSGNFVIAWESFLQDGLGDGVFARRYNAAGVPQGGEFQVNVVTTGGQGEPAVSMDADGDFLIAWHGVASGSNDIFARSYNAAGVAQAGEFLVNTFTTFNQSFPVVALDHEGDAVILWQSDGQDTSGYGVYGQRYEQSPDTAAPVVGDVVIGGEPVTQNERIVQAPTSIVLRMSEDMVTTGGGSANSTANYSLTRNGVSVPISSANFAIDFSIDVYQATLSFAAPLPDGNYVLSAKQALQDVSGNALDGNFDGAPGGDFTRAFTIAVPVAIGPEFRVNTTTANRQRISNVASDADGDFVITWMSQAQDGDGYGVYAQRYNAAGVPQGGEFRVNTFTTGNQQDPVIAMDLDGDFVIVWSGAGLGDSTGIYAQRYNASGIPQGGEFRVNSGTGAVQNVPAVAMDAAGNFVATWSSDNQSNGNFDVFARRYNNAGVALTNEFRVNTFTTDNQGGPVVAMDFDGDFVIAWNSFNQEPFNLGVYAQRYNRDGFAQGNEFRVNTFTTGDQMFPEIGMDADGDFVIAWTSSSQDGSGHGVYAQRYNAVGFPIPIFEGEFQVNNTTTNGQFVHGMAMDADGDFVITWHSEQQDGSADATLARRYNALAEPQGNEFFVNTFTTQSQFASAATMDADGDFIITWTSINQDGSLDGIYAQRYGSVLAPAVNTSSFLFETAPHRLQFTFSQQVGLSLGTNDILLENLTTSQTIPAGDLALAYDALTNVATFTYIGSSGGISGVLRDGNYRATLLAGGITNSGGQPLAANHVLDFFFLNGDANRDGRVNLLDFDILAANFGQTNRTFSQADFNYDTRVNLLDFDILASRFGQVLGAADRSAAFGSNQIDDSSEQRDDPLAMLLE